MLTMLGAGPSVYVMTSAATIATLAPGTDKPLRSVAVTADAPIVLADTQAL